MEKLVMTGIACAALMVGCAWLEAPLSLGDADRDVPISILVETSFPSHGPLPLGAGFRGVNDDSLVTKVLVEAFDSTPSSVGTGQLSWNTGTSKWSGILQVSALGPTIFKAWAKDANDNQYYYGASAAVNISGSNQGVAIPTQRAVTFAEPIKIIRFTVIGGYDTHSDPSGAFCLSEIQVLRNGTPQLLVDGTNHPEWSGALSGFNIVGNISNNSFANDSNNYAWIQNSGPFTVTFSSAVSGLQGIRLGVTGFSNKSPLDGLDYTPNGIRLEISKDGSTFTQLSTPSYVRTDFTDATAKDILF